MARNKEQATIAFVGIDGAGKTTQASLLTQQLQQLGRPVTYRLAASGRRAFSRAARRLGYSDAVSLLGPSLAIRAETLLRYANLRIAQRSPLLISDRYNVCQYARARIVCPRIEPWVRQRMRRLNRPALTLFFEIDPTIAHKRVIARGIDNEKLDDLQALDDAYRSLPEADDFVYVDAAAPIDDVFETIQHEVRHRLPSFYNDEALLVHGPSPAIYPPDLPCGTDRRYRRLSRRRGRTAPFSSGHMGDTDRRAPHRGHRAVVHARTADEQATTIPCEYGPGRPR